MKLQKYCASGNDFLICHTLHDADWSKTAIDVCDRHYGFGADGFIVLLPHPTLDYAWKFYNSDGSSADMCANGTRAVTLYAHDNHIAGTTQRFLTGAGVISSHIYDANTVETQLTPPKKIAEPFEEHGFLWSFVDTGVPHLCTHTTRDTFSLDIARAMRTKYNANVNFYAVDNDIVYVRTYERGVEDETLACGTGMAACALSLSYRDRTKSAYDIRPKSGEKITIKVTEGEILFKGVVKRVGDCLS